MLPRRSSAKWLVRIDIAHLSRTDRRGTGDGPADWGVHRAPAPATLGPDVGGADGGRGFLVSERSSPLSGRHARRRASFPDPGRISAGRIVSNPDGALWFTTENAIGRGSRMSGTVTTYSVLDEVAGPSGSGAITVGSDGNMWFTTERPGRSGGITIDQVVVTLYSPGGLSELEWDHGGPGRQSVVHRAERDRADHDDLEW